MSEKTLSTCDRCGKGKFYSGSFDDAKGLVDDGPLGYGARIVFSEKEKTGWSNQKVIILCRLCLEKLLPLLTEKT